MIQLQWLQQKMKLVLKDYTKIAIWCGELFWCRKWATFWLTGGTFPHPQGFQQRFGERGKAVDTLWRQQSKIKEGEIFRKKEDAGGGEGVILLLPSHPTHPQKFSMRLIDREQFTKIDIV